MRAWQLNAPQPITAQPLTLVDLPEPAIGDHDLRFGCGPAACATPTCTLSRARSLPISCRWCPATRLSAPWRRRGRRCTRFKLGDRVGVPWLNWADGACDDCRRGRENLCDAARFTGYDVDGGYAEYQVTDEHFAYPIPAGFADEAAAPLLCAGWSATGRCGWAGHATSAAGAGTASAHRPTSPSRWRGTGAWSVVCSPAARSTAAWRENWARSGPAARGRPRRADG